MRVLLFSTDEYFLTVFGGYLSKEKLEMDLFSYSDGVAAEQAIETQKFDLILCEEGYLAKYREEPNYVALGMHTVYPSDGQGGLLNIYQKASRIKEELEYMIKVLDGKKLSGEQETASMISFFSTEGGAGKTTLAYLTAVECARYKKTLYMNLEPLAVTEQLYDSDKDGCMEDILLTFDKKREETLSVLLNAIDKTSEGVYVLPTLSNIGDYLELSASVVLQLIQTVCNMSGMENVILDLPGSFSALTEPLLMESKKIVWIYNDGRDGKKKLQKVKEDPYLKARGILSKSVYVLNRCENQATAAEYHAAFPVSKTLSTAKRISKIVEVNEAFSTGCKNIAKHAGLL